MHDTKWVLFDVGGVLLDWRTSATSLAGFLGVTLDLLLDTMFVHAPQMNVGAITPQEGWRKILAELGRQDNPQVIIERWRSKEFWLADTLQLVREFHGAGYNLGILSNSWLGLTSQTEDVTMPQEMMYFSYILDSSKVGMKKPNPKFYELAEQTTGAQGKQILFIDDDALNLEPAKAMSWQVYHYDMGDDLSGRQANSDLSTQLL
jgi:FMN phosphatase YigB (HAD superfamily)